MSDPTTTLALQALPQGDLSQRITTLLKGRLATALVVAAMWALAVVDWLSIYAGNAPNRKIFAAILIMAAVLAAGRIRQALFDKRR